MLEKDKIFLAERILKFSQLTQNFAPKMTEKKNLGHFRADIDLVGLGHSIQQLLVDPCKGGTERLHASK